MKNFGIKCDICYGQNSTDLVPSLLFDTLAEKSGLEKKLLKKLGSRQFLY